MLLVFVLISGGCPWWADGNDAVESRYFISSLIGTIRASGWEVSFNNQCHWAKIVKITNYALLQSKIITL